MKFIKHILFLLLFVNLAQAQTVNVIRNDTAATTIQSNNLGNSKISTDNKGVVFVQGSGGGAVGTKKGTFTHTQPTITTATSFTCLAANANRNMVLIENNSTANIMINLNNGTLTGIVPTSTNLGIVLTPGSSYNSPPNAVPIAAVTCYQTSGGNINTVSVMEQ